MDLEELKNSQNSIWNVIFSEKSNLGFLSKIELQIAELSKIYQIYKDKDTDLDLLTCLVS